MIIGGIDPGKSGAIVALDTEGPSGDWYLLEYNQQDLKYNELIGFMHDMKIDLVIMEKVVGRKIGSTSTFNFGMAFGQIIMATRLSAIPYRMITPQGWQKLIHEGADSKLDSKNKSAQVYRQMFPHEPIPRGPRKGKINENVLDALLIATYGVLKYGQGTILPWTFKQKEKDA